MQHQGPRLMEGYIDVRASVKRRDIPVSSRLDSFDVIPDSCPDMRLCRMAHDLQRASSVSVTGSYPGIRTRAKE